MLTTLLPVLGPIIQSLVDRIPDPAAAQKAKEQAESALLTALVKEMEGQTAINVEEAKNPSVFVSGWRPAIGWSCATAFAFMYVVAPIAQWLGLSTTVPQFNADALMSLTFGMLGIAGFRTFEKVKGVSR